MSVTVEIGEAEKSLTELIRRVEAGEEVIIARGGRAVARLLPLAERTRRRATIEAMLRERDDGSRQRVTRDEVLAWRHEGHHW